MVRDAIATLNLMQFIRRPIEAAMQTTTNESNDADKYVADEENTLQPYHCQDEQNRTAIVLGWILDKKIDNTTLTSLKILKDGVVSTSITKLKDVPNKSKLRRIFESELGLVKPYLSSYVYSLLLDFKSEYGNSNALKWQCMECNKDFNKCDGWKCDLCSLWFHENCKYVYPRGPRAQKYCIECYTH